MGTTRFYDFDPKLRQIVIGYTFLGRQFWGDGSNAECKRLMLGHAYLWVENAHFHIGEDNLRYQKAVEKLGAVRRGVATLNGQPRLVYEITKRN